jgi:hypothetical protein
LGFAGVVASNVAVDPKKERIFIGSH